MGFPLCKIFAFAFPSWHVLAIHNPTLGNPAARGVFPDDDGEGSMVLKSVSAVFTKICCTPPGYKTPMWMGQGDFRDVSISCEEDPDKKGEACDKTRETMEKLVETIEKPGSGIVLGNTDQELKSLANPPTVDITNFSLGVSYPENGLYSRDDINYANVQKSCKFCQWTGANLCDWDDAIKVCGHKSNEQCYYPIGASWIKHSKIFGADVAGCKAQGAARARFNGQALDETGVRVFSNECVVAYYAIGGIPQDQASKFTQANLATAVATDAEIALMTTSCAGVPELFLEKLTMRKNEPDIVLVVANTPRKASLEGLYGEEFFKNFFGFRIAGTGSTVKILKAHKDAKSLVYAETKKNAEPALRLSSGPEGGDLQGGVLMALGHVRLLIFFQSYHTECHKCDIFAFTRICNKMASQRKMLGCAYNIQQTLTMAPKLNNMKF